MAFSSACSSIWLPMSSAQVFLGRLPIEAGDDRARSSRPDKGLRFQSACATGPKKEIGQRGAPADPMVTHNEELGVGPPHSAQVEAEGAAVKPHGAGLLVIFEREPQMLELLGPLVVCAVPQVDDVRNAQGA